MEVKQVQQGNKKCPCVRFMSACLSLSRLGHASSFDQMYLHQWPGIMYFNCTYVPHVVQSVCMFDPDESKTKVPGLLVSFVVNW